MSRNLVLNYQEAVHLTAFLKRVRGWDNSAFVRIQTRGKVVALWAATPMECLAFVAVPLAEAVETDFDTTVFATRMRDILGDLSQMTDSNRVASYPLPDDMPVPLPLQELPPVAGWIPSDKQTCGPLTEIVEKAIEQFHQQAAQLPNADRKVLDMIAGQIWKGPGVAHFPLKGLHAARQLGFLSVANARAEFSTHGSWKRLVTPAGQVFFDESPKKPKLRVIASR